MSKLPVALRKFLLRYLLVHLIVTSIFVWVLSTIVHDKMVAENRQKMSAIAVLVSEHLEGLEEGFRSPELFEFLDRIADKTGFRFTVVINEGDVLYDSETDSLEIGDHSDRPEIADSKFDMPGFSERFSKTLQKKMIYLAMRTRWRDRETGIIRVALSVSSISEAIQSLQTYVWLFVVLLSLLTAPVMILLFSQTMQPLSLFSDAAQKIGMGQYNATPSLVDRADEWGLLSEAFRRMQKELQSRERGMLENSARLEAVLSSMIEGVIAIAPDDTVMLANNAACRMLNFSRGEVIGRRLLDVVRIPELGTAIEKTQREETFSKSEFQTLAPSRRTISARVSVLRKSEENSGPPGVTLVMQDVTDLRQLENMRRDFVANVSHELKTPLSSIMAYAETLKLGAIHDTEKNLDFVEQIETQANMLNLQIQDLMQLARVESGKEVWDIQTVAINAACATCYEMFLAPAKQVGIELGLELTEIEPRIKADEEGLSTILNNLVSNAIHYTPAGGSVTVRTRTDGDEVLIEVVDTGIGIGKEHHHRIFERFYRVDKARSRDKGGTGLGLAIVKHLVQAFGGTIGLSSKIGKGTTFQVRFASADLPKRMD